MGKNGASEKLETRVHLMCGWPLALVFVGGAIGGGLGGGAYAINLALHKSKLPAPLKVIGNVAVGTVAVLLWLFAVAWIRGGESS